MLKPIRQTNNIVRSLCLIIAEYQAKQNSIHSHLLLKRPFLFLPFLFKNIPQFISIKILVYSPKQKQENEKNSTF